AFQVDLDDSLVRVSDLDGRFDNTQFTGDGQWDGIGKRLTGVVDAAALDLGPMIRSVYPVDGPEPQPDTGIDTDREKPISLPEIVSTLDIDLRLAIDQIVGVPGELRNVTARLVAGDGRLRLPVALNVLGTTVGGEAILSRQEETMTLSVELAADKTDLGRAVGEGYGGAGVAGWLDRLELSASASGASLSALLKNLDARLDIRNVDLTIDGKSASRPMRVVLDAATVTLPAGAGLKGTVTGKMIGKSFSLNVAGGGMRDILEKSRWPVDLRFVGSGARLHLAGIFSPLGDTAGPELSIRLSGDRIGALAAWTGISPLATMPYVMDAAGSLHRNRWRLEVRRLNLGNSTLRGSIGGKLSTNRQLKTSLSVHSDSMDVAQLNTLFILPDAGDRSATAPQQPNPAERNFAPILDTMIFPQDFHLPEMDVNLNIRRVLTEKLSYDDCSLKATIRRDRTSASRFQFALGKSSFNGEASLDLVRQPPALGLRFSANRLDLGQLLEAFGVADGIDARAASLDVIVTTRGRRLAELIIQREISVRVQQGQWVLTDTNTGAAVTIGIDRAEFSDKPGDPFRLDVGGHIQDTPLTMRWEIQKKRPNDAPGDGHPYQLETEAAGTRLALTGRLVFPLRKRGLEHRLVVSGNRLDSLEPLLTVSLPPWGPYEMTGVIRVQPDGYSLSEAAVSIGDSRFRGQLYIGTAAARPKVTANLEATTMQLADFGRKASAPGQGRPAATGRQPGRSADSEDLSRLRQLLDPSSASPVDADVSVSVSEVLAGTNRLGSGNLRMTREANRISVSPLALSIPGGDVNGTVDLRRIDDGVQGTLKVDIHQLAYGPLLRLKDPNTENNGRVSLVIDLKSTADSMDALLAQANGRVAVSIQPENIRAGVIDFWATNLLTNTLSVLNPNNESKINCIDADLVMADGIMTEKSIVIDTSRIRVRGSAHVDFKQQTVHLKLTPTPKRPQFISLATPIEVRGKFSDFVVGLAPGGLVGTTIRLLTAHIVVPIQWIILNKLPEDGRDVCREAISNHFP
ncbi:MAG: AsmA-like C-terminal region-containing protein, partial [Desulfobacterales bacterium]